MLAAVLTGCDEAPESQPPGRGSTAPTATSATEALPGVSTIRAGGRSVNVSCSGAPSEGRPVIVLLLGAGDGLEKMAPLPETLSEKDLVCSYDRLGAGASDPRSSAISGGGGGRGGGEQ